MIQHKKFANIKYVLFVVIFVFLFLFIAGVLFPKHLYKEQPNDAAIMIVEGWLPDYALRKSIKEFNAGDYKIMITIGTNMPDAFRVHSLGSLIFNLENSHITNSDEVAEEIAVNARGTIAAKEYPYFYLYINDSLTGESYVNKKSKIYEFYANTLVNKIKTIKIQYDNDGYTYWRDRDLYIEYIKINNIKIPAYSDMAFYDMNRPDDYRQYSPRFNNNAEYAAFILYYSGFTDSIKAIPVLHTKISRTYSCALAFKEWYMKSTFEGKPVNIVSLGPHTRRTWMIYKKVLGKNTDVGIILVNSVNYDISNWWKSLAGIKDTIHEMASYIYTTIVLPFVTPLRTL